MSLVVFVSTLFNAGTYKTVDINGYIHRGWRMVRTAPTLVIPKAGIKFPLAHHKMQKDTQKLYSHTMNTFIQ